MEAVFFAFIIALNLCSLQAESEDQWLEVPLDHFNLFGNQTWQMRYLINDEFFKKGNPLFIEIGGEWTISGDNLHSGQIYKLAKSHQGMLVETEHRYYGKSLPFSTNFSTQNLQFLQIEQALEDLAYFVEKFKAMKPDLNESKVIVHGCSYAGMLATWMRLKYPKTVHVAYASSAPLGVGLVYPEYYEVVAEVYAKVGEKCIETIRQGFNETEKLLRTKEGREHVRQTLKDWKLGDIYNMNSVEILNNMREVLNTQDDPIKYEELVCEGLASNSSANGAFEKLAEIIVKKSADLDSWSENENEEEKRNSRAWDYQTCTEIGTFQTLNRKNSKHPFAMDISLEESVDECVNDFGEMMNENILRTGIERVNRRYGGKKPKVKRVVSVQGTSDPWKRLSSLEDYNSEAPVIVVEGSHCVDVSQEDESNINEVRKKVREIISKWIKQIS